MTDDTIEFEESLSDILVGIGLAFAIFAVVIAEVGLWSVERGNVKAEKMLKQVRIEANLLESRISLAHAEKALEHMQSIITKAISRGPLIWTKRPALPSCRSLNFNPGPDNPPDSFCEREARAIKCQGEISQGVIVEPYSCVPWYVRTVPPQ